MFRNSFHIPSSLNVVVELRVGVGQAYKQEFDRLRGQSNAGEKSFDTSNIAPIKDNSTL